MQSGDPEISTLAESAENPNVLTEEIPRRVSKSKRQWNLNSQNLNIKSPERTQQSDPLPVCLGIIASKVFVAVLWQELFDSRAKFKSGTDLAELLSILATRGFMKRLTTCWVRQEPRLTAGDAMLI